MIFDIEKDKEILDNISNSNDIKAGDIFENNLKRDCLFRSFENTNKEVFNIKKNIRIKRREN